MRRSTFAIPAVIAGLQVAGLYAALTGDGTVDQLASAGLCVPVVIVAWCVARRDGRRRRNH